ncbi:HIT zinc finger protein [Apiospora rasikravindrae]|uniref:HIT zinc finger protein n=1 Tax=Apiospora rasikravindrae TaxID=990691 RepID=A0ABR1SWY6_9PEZI
MDPLLTSLCSVCRTREPKYKCPRCGTNTCSLPCVKRHKKWSSCNGQRDPTVYMPPAKLRTDAGIDHDYNFLTKIERSLEQTEKLLVEERGILPDPAQQNDQFHGPPYKKARLNKGQSRGRTTLEGGSRSWARAAVKKLNTLGITVKHQPYGMTRPKNNATSFNKRTQTINWQVEWCFLDPAASSPEKLLNKTLDNVPMYLAYADCREYHRRSQMSKKEKEQEKKQKQIEDAAADAEETGEDDNGNITFRGQDWKNSTWTAAAVPFQSTDGCWHVSTTTSERKPRKLSERQRRAKDTKNEYQFYFHIPGTPSREPQKLIPISPDDDLASVLAGMEVLEFPSIYITRAGTELPQGYQLAKRPTNSSTSQGAPGPTKKRKSEELVEYASEEEEGEIAEADDDAEPQSEMELDPADDTTSSSGSDSDSDEEME